MTGIPCEISVENSVEKLQDLYDGLQQFVAGNGLSEALRNRLFLVVEELFTNLVRHGYADGREDVVRVTAERQGPLVFLTIRDHGEAFDVSQTPRPPADDLDLDDMAIGGLGLFLVHEFAQSVKNRRENTLNVTEVVLTADGAGSAV